MCLSDWIKYKIIMRKINKAKKQGYGSIEERSYLNLASLSPVLKQKLKEQGIRISEMQWDIKFSWRKFCWDSNKEAAPPSYKTF